MNISIGSSSTLKESCGLCIPCSAAEDGMAGVGLFNGLFDVLMYWFLLTGPKTVTDVI